jgi:hypothetical protein
MQIDAKSIEFALDYGVQKITFKRHKFRKLPFHSSLFENQLNKFEFKIVRPKSKPT